MPQHVEFGVLREHTIDPAAVYEITLHGAHRRRPDRKISADVCSTCYRRPQFSRAGWSIQRR